MREGIRTSVEDWLLAFISVAALSVMLFETTVIGEGYFSIESIVPIAAQAWIARLAAAAFLWSIGRLVFVGFRANYVWTIALTGPLTVRALVEAVTAGP